MILNKLKTNRRKEKNVNNIQTFLKEMKVIVDFAIKYSKALNHNEIPETEIEKVRDAVESLDNMWGEERLQSALDAMQDEQADIKSIVEDMLEEIND